ncbi:hypothetical protein [Spiroplasma endosymbiont of Cantharis nigra]|uniref:hypothetical protein n=1 Tax=Spiroplasma endosymbiont of Cantharis nigra TaxID=3066278 RepID=UPI0030D3C5E7
MNYYVKFENDFFNIVDGRTNQIVASFIGELEANKFIQSLIKTTNRAISNWQKPQRNNFLYDNNFSSKKIGIHEDPFQLKLGQSAPYGVSNKYLNENRGSNTQPVNNVQNGIPQQNCEKSQVPSIVQNFIQSPYPNMQQPNFYNQNMQQPPYGYPNMQQPSYPTYNGPTQNFGIMNGQSSVPFIPFQNSGYVADSSNFNNQMYNQNNNEINKLNNEDSNSKILSGQINNLSDQLLNLSGQVNSISDKLRNDENNNIENNRESEINNIYFEEPNEKINNFLNVNEQSKNEGIGNYKHNLFSNKKFEDRYKQEKINQFEDRYEQTNIKEFENKSELEQNNEEDFKIGFNDNTISIDSSLFEEDKLGAIIQENKVFINNTDDDSLGEISAYKDLTGFNNFKNNNESIIEQENINLEDDLKIVNQDFIDKQNKKAKINGLDDLPEVNADFEETPTLYLSEVASELIKEHQEQKEGREIIDQIPEEKKIFGLDDLPDTIKNITIGDDESDEFEKKAISEIYQKNLIPENNILKKRDPNVIDLGPVNEDDEIFSTPRRDAELEDLDNVSLSKKEKKELRRIKRREENSRKKYEKLLK